MTSAHDGRHRIPRFYAHIQTDKVKKVKGVGVGGWWWWYQKVKTQAEGGKGSS